MNVCVYCSSSAASTAEFGELADETGRLLAERGHTLVYGGGDVGLMGRLARSVHANHGMVFGAIPEALKAREGVAYEIADELIVTETMQERKAMMYEKADAFIVLPGGFGTLEEFMEVLTLKQLGYHRKPLVLLNASGFFDPLLELFEHLFRLQFARSQYRRLYHVARDAADAVRHIETFRARS